MVGCLHFVVRCGCVLFEPWSARGGGGDMVRDGDGGSGLGSYGREGKGRDGEWEERKREAWGAKPVQRRNHGDCLRRNWGHGVGVWENRATLPRVKEMFTWKGDCSVCGKKGLAMAAVKEGGGGGHGV